VEIGSLGGGGTVGIDDDELGAAFPPRRRDMGHHIDLGRGRVAAPDDDQVGFRDLAPVDAAFGPDAGEPARVGERIADRQILARITHRVAQPVDAVALHQPHRAGVVIGPHALGAVALSGAGQRLGDLVECLVPGDRPKRIEARTLFTDPAQRLREALRVMLALGIARDLGADHAPSVGLRRRSPEPSEAPSVDALDVERARTRAIVRAHTGDDVERQGSAPGLSLQKYRDELPGSGGGGPASLFAAKRNPKFYPDRPSTKSTADLQQTLI
jgi:hypothetical protein